MKSIFDYLSLGFLIALGILMSSPAFAVLSSVQMPSGLATMTSLQQQGQANALVDFNEAQEIYQKNHCDTDSSTKICQETVARLERDKIFFNNANENATGFDSEHSQWTGGADDGTQIANEDRSKDYLKLADCRQEALQSGSPGSPGYEIHLRNCKYVNNLR